MREARYDAPADQHDETDHSRDRDADSIVGGTARDRLEVEHYIAGDQYAEHDEDAEIAPVLAGDQLSQHHRCERSEKRNVNHTRNHCAPNRRAGDRHPAGKPQRGKAGQRIAIDRQSPGPIGNRREQEAGDNRGHIPVDHLMDMPIERRQRRWQRQLAEILR